MCLCILCEEDAQKMEIENKNSPNFEDKAYQLICTRFVESAILKFNTLKRMSSFLSMRYHC